MDARWFSLSDAAAPMYEQFWIEPIDDSLYTSWRDARLQPALADYKAHGLWFDDLLAPAFSQHGGQVNAASDVRLSNPTSDPTFGAMSIYFTMDGSDPRLPDGAVNPTAMVADASALAFGAGETMLRARVHDAGSGRWSPCNEAVFKFMGSTMPIVVSEIFYNPPGPSEDEEFIELLNISGTQAIDLSGYHFSAGITFTFPAGVILLPGGRIVVAKDLSTFVDSYGSLPEGTVFGPYGGSLDNGGERIVLSAPDGTRVIDCSYDDDPTWPPLADGAGQSLELSSPESNPDTNVASSWIDGFQPGGSPGYLDSIDFATWGSDRGVIEPLGDPDGDGQSNLVEYGIGSDPHVATSGPSTSISIEGGQLMIGFRRDLAANDVRYAVEVSGDLSFSTLLATERLATRLVRHGDGTGSEVYRCLVPAASLGRVFVRLRVSS